MILWADGYFVMYLDRFIDMSGYGSRVWLNGDETVLKFRSIHESFLSDS